MNDLDDNAALIPHALETVVQRVLIPCRVDQHTNFSEVMEVKRRSAPS
jgi:hypothetical protein